MNKFEKFSYEELIEEFLFGEFDDPMPILEELNKKFCEEQFSEIVNLTTRESASPRLYGGYVYKKQNIFFNVQSKAFANINAPDAFDRMYARLHILQTLFHENRHKIQHLELALSEQLEYASICFAVHRLLDIKDQDDLRAVAVTANICSHSTPWEIDAREFAMKKILDLAKIPNLRSKTVDFDNTPFPFCVYDFVLRQQKFSDYARDMANFSMIEYIDQLEQCLSQPNKVNSDNTPYETILLLRDAVDKVKYFHETHGINNPQGEGKYLERLYPFEMGVNNYKIEEKISDIMAGEEPSPL